jgi:uncharacterized repeat protein (TIGR01451 family)
MHTTHSASRWESITHGRGRWLVPVVALALLSLYLISSPYIWAASSSARPGASWPEPDSIQAYKTASQWMVGSGQALTYTIHIRNAGMADTTAQVVDPIPSNMNYLSGSASLGAIYDLGTNTLTWPTLTVTRNSEVNLTFVVTAATVTTPTLVMNTATITAGLASLTRSANVIVLPASLAVADLSPSAKYAAHTIVLPGDSVPYTIKLINAGTVSANADITDPLPLELNYVPGSASAGGTYDAGTRTLTWQHIAVPAFGHVGLTFVATTTTSIVSPTVVVNTATIVAGQQQINRQATIVIVPHPEVPPHPLLAGSYKKASERWITADDTLTYTVKLVNSGADDALVNVTDPVPSALSYVTGSANNGGVYDPGTQIVSWEAITVPAWSSVPLEFAVMATSAVTHPMLVMNTATISVTGDGTLRRQAPVMLLPTASGDRIDPVVHSLTIDDQDVLTSPTTTLHISATDNISVSQMFIREWLWTAAPSPHWAVSQSSGWVPYQADYPWTLLPKDGVHFVAVWVADAARNVSELDRSALDFASLVRPNATVTQRHFVPYLVYYPAGVTVTAQLTSTTGDADLYVWRPHNFLWPDWKSTRPVSGTDVVTFTTTHAGIYVFLVRGYTDATYNLSIEPAGGPRAGTDSWDGDDDHGHAAITVPAPTGVTIKPDDLTFEPALSQSGLDPLVTAPAPDGFYQLYLPTVIR